MCKILKNETAGCVAVLCFGLLSSQNLAAQFVEISAEIETLHYRLDNTNSIARTRPKTIHVTCVAGASKWFIEEDYVFQTKWLFDGAQVVSRSQPLTSFNGVTSLKDVVLPSSDGHPLGDLGVNLPWLAFCSGSYLKRPGRLIPLPAALLRHCSDRFAYTDVTTTFADELGLPRSLDLFTSPTRFLQAHTDWDKAMGFGDRYTEWNQQTAAKIQEGMLVFHYAVLESTNLLGRSFPTRFQFFQIGRPYEENGNWFYQGTGRVLSISQSTSFPSFK
jgi:hypothetical protein